jgi:23S rRNA pseudouridine1911/1915/1917 synthase
LSNTLPDLDTEEIEDDDAAPAPIELTLDSRFCGVRLDKAVAQLVPQYSRSRLQQWFEAGLVLVDGRPARARSAALGDETVTIHPQALPEEQAYAAQEMPLTLLHEDAAVLVIDKPAGLVVHPAAGNWSGTLLNGLLHRFPELAGVPRAGIVHRLDKDTSGLMAVARTLEAQTDLVRQLQARTVRREYLALVWGSPRPAGRVEAAIARHPRDRLRMAVSSHPNAKPAITHYTRLAAGTLAGQPVSLLRCSLETGRTHQIRVHMQSLGFPLVGDPLYGKPHLAPVFSRQALHAQRLGLIHPRSGKECAWRSPLPEDFSELLARAGIASAAAD